MTSPADTIHLADGSSSAASIVPARGGIVLRFRAGERDLLYLDDSTLLDPAKNVRGGIPVLFPSPGRLTGDRFSRAGKSGSMRQHGFAREKAWTARTGGDACSSGTSLRLAPDDTTRASFPWEFLVTADYRLQGTRLLVSVRVENPSRDTVLPFAFGFHPYFLVEDKARARVATRATRAFDNVTKQVVPFRGFDLAAGEVDLHLIDHGSTDSELAFGDGARLLLSASPEFTRWVVWTLPGRDFVCVEPWTAPADALNTGESLIELAPLATRVLWFAMEYVAR